MGSEEETEYEGKNTATCSICLKKLKFLSFAVDGTLRDLCCCVAVEFVPADQASRWLSEEEPAVDWSPEHHAGGGTQSTRRWTWRRVCSFQTRRAEIQEQGTERREEMLLLFYFIFLFRNILNKMYIFKYTLCMTWQHILVLLKYSLKTSCYIIVICSFKVLMLSSHFIMRSFIFSCFNVFQYLFCSSVW